MTYGEHRDPWIAKSTTPAERLEDLRVEAQYARERYQLYRAKAYGPRPTTLGRMRELQRNYEFAEARLRAAETDAQNPER